MQAAEPTIGCNYQNFGNFVILGISLRTTCLPVINQAVLPLPPPLGLNLCQPGKLLLVPLPPQRLLRRHGARLVPLSGENALPERPLGLGALCGSAGLGASTLEGLFQQQGPDKQIMKQSL